PKSKRYVDLKQLEKLVRTAREKSAIVTVNMEFSDLSEIISRFSPGFIQLHGNESVDFIRLLKERFPSVGVIKKVTVDMRDKFKAILKTADFLLCDASTRLHGGSGKSFNWSLLQTVPGEMLCRLFVAGGVKAENISRLKTFSPGGIDVATGSEISPGIKDPQKVREIVRRAGDNER
ncbi:MAG: phosphoribosylanthranilate isomerase, partial [Elusimicrobiota bacterium]